MNQEYPDQYYMVLDEKSTGPFTLDEVTLHPKLTPETLVWKPGLQDWVPAKTLPELFPAFNRQSNNYEKPPKYNHINNNDNTNEYNQVNENRDFNRFADNPQYQSNHNYHQHHRYYNPNDRYRNDYRPSFRTNWLPWAIVATIVGFFASCLGAIFGIIGIVQANKANTLYAQGFDREGDQANSNAKIMTIIGLILAGIGILIAISFGGVFTSLGNLSYL